MKLVVSGIGAHCSLGKNTEALWESLEQGKCGIDIISRFDVSPFDTQLGAMVSPENDNVSDEQRLLKYAKYAAMEALEYSGITNLNQVCLVLGTSNGLMGEKISNVSYNLAEELKLGGMVFTFSTACTSSAHALGFAADLIKRNHSTFVLVGGVDILTRDIFAGFYNLGLLSKTPCAPFSSKIGTTLGEGAAFLFLETGHSAELRGIKPLASFLGYGIAADGYHDTKPDPGGSGVCRAISFAMQDAGLKSTEIEYINAHGTATAANDSAEWLGIQNALGNHSRQIPVSSSKSFLGHAQGAAGALEVVTTLISMNHGVIPPTLNYINPRPASPKDPVATFKPRQKEIKYSLSTNSGFGGVNSALIFGHADIEPLQTTKSQRPLSISGYGFNTDYDSISQYIPESEIRGLDRTALLLTGAIAKTLEDAAIRFRSMTCEDIGLIVDQEYLSPDSVEALYSSIEERGIKHLSASAFTRMVVNYPTGVCCRLFGLKGPVATMTARPDNGLSAFIYAADFLAWRDDSDLLLVAEVHEPGLKNDSQAGAAGILLKAKTENAGITLNGWSMDKNREFATEKALSMACLKASEVTPVTISLSSEKGVLHSLIEILNRIKANKNGFFLIRNHETDSLGVAIIIERR